LREERITSVTYPDDELARAAEVIRAAVAEAELDYAEAEPGSFAITLPGQRKLKTVCWLIVGGNGLHIDAFVVRKPDENADGVHRWLLAHNPKIFGVAWAIDDAGDIYLTGRWPLSAVTSEDVDRLLGTVLDQADSSFNTLLELGFGGSIRREWEWRESRGESLANLAAFEGYVRRNAPAEPVGDADPRGQ
jgi:hypothetical protein